MSENQAPNAPALFSGALPVPEVENAASAALWVASASTASSHSTPVTSSTSWMRQAGWPCAPPAEARAADAAFAERELALRQRDDPAVGGELSGPDDIHVDDVVQVALGLKVGDQLGQLVVGRLGQPPQGYLLAGVVLAPAGAPALQPA